MVAKAVWALSIAGAGSLWAFWLAALWAGCPRASYLLAGEFGCLGVVLATLCAVAAVAGKSSKPGV